MGDLVQQDPALSAERYQKICNDLEKHQYACIDNFLGKSWSSNLRAEVLAHKNKLVQHKFEFNGEILQKPHIYEL